MVINLVNFLISCAIAIYFMLPAYVSNLSGLAFGGGTPMDKGKTLSDGYRIIGNGVTWKGFISGTILGTLVGGIQGFLSINLTQISGGIITLNVFQSIPNGLILGFILAFGALLGDAVGSFIKRRLGISSGKPAPFLDQLDFVIMSLLLISFIVPLSIDFVLIIAFITLILHLSSNTIAYLLGIKDVWY
ncbi:MAG: CDP-2,3-bis-(O-geranylgeranyl)-sn-glycerol synthase [Methanobacteriaceae archaeon]|jgi:CDP-2,3-bis-(O-geranylgeranyl)-sn-glycerol synthase|uniref:CDP-2,3-bis-(O-geranylgeranyl)-sn-glycerol synthase n=1 Tax=unclassified Methanobrevibacter TaxID=2638681 RepID=UPI002A16B925|nr:CDP-2,3-bis-(O-geranylgeranyl)-sn-glycerol synthase [Methanobacteriaceae archaeon]MDD3408088.1 CDP-2,3-bis-(O-geranylgeranyl)-sn-glycerol synthase [Methanobacteriaceae archaeon]MDD4594328.1 CDP-2,3-bis-(O-geranylgeranyl)-sn-glycerol synthase [Methanobacteriaceae archaeon]